MKSPQSRDITKFVAEETEFKRAPFILQNAENFFLKRPKPVLDQRRYFEDKSIPRFRDMPTAMEMTSKNPEMV